MGPTWACNGSQSSNLTTGEVAKALRRPARAVWGQLDRGRSSPKKVDRPPAR